MGNLVDIFPRRDHALRYRNTLSRFGFTLIFPYLILGGLSLLEGLLSGTTETLSLVFLKTTKERLMAAARQLEVCLRRRLRTQ